MSIQKIITDYKRSCGKVMFPQVFVCPWGRVRVSLVLGPFQGVGYHWSQVLGGGRLSGGGYGGGVSRRGGYLWLVRMLLAMISCSFELSLLLPPKTQKNIE